MMGLTSENFPKPLFTAGSDNANLMQEEEENSPEARRWVLCRSLGDGACRSDGCSSATKIPRYEYLCVDTSQTALAARLHQFHTPAYTTAATGVCGGFFPSLFSH